MKKQLLLLAPGVVALGALVGCKGGSTPSGEDVLESISASTKTSYYNVNGSFDKDELNVFANYTKSGLKTLTKDQYTVSETLPYTFKEEDVSNGKTFNITFSGKSTNVTAKVQEDMFKKIDWNTNKVHNSKTLYEIAKGTDINEIIFGKKSDYTTEVSGYTSFNVDEANKGYIKGYLPTSAPETTGLYILVESDSHKIQFDENDRIKVESIFQGPFSDLNASKITFNKKLINFEFNDFSYMFKGSKSLTAINGINLIPPFDTSLVTDMSHMFDGCSSLTELDLHTFSTDRVTKFDCMFNGCTQLKTIYASKYFEVKSTATSKEMFTGCTSIVGGNKTKYNESNVDGTYARIDADGTHGYFTSK